jgi:hypothetical protein
MITCTALGRHGAPAGGQGGDQSGPGRSGELQDDVGAVGGGAPQQLDGGRHRIGDEPVGGADHADPLGHRAAVDVVDLEDLEGDTGPDDVDDRVEATHLVEVHL